jgi:hypothetical protein
MIVLEQISNKIVINSGWDKVMQAIHDFQPEGPNDHCSPSDWMSKSQVKVDLDCMGSFTAPWGNTKAGKLGRSSSFMDHHLDFVLKCLTASNLDWTWRA